MLGGLKRFKTIAFQPLLIQFITIPALLVLYFKFHLGLKPLLVVQMAAIAAGIIYYITQLREYVWTKPVFDLVLLKSMLLFGLPLLVGFSFNYIYKLSDRYFLKFWFNSSAVGIYHASDKLASVMTVLLQPLSVVLLPTLVHLYQQDKMNEIKALFRMVKKSIFLIGCFGAIFSFCFAGVILKWLSRFHGEGLNSITGLLALSYMFHFLQYLYITPFIFTSQIRNLWMVYSTGIILVLLLNYIFIPPLGPLGAAIATLIASGTMFIFNYFLARKRLKTCRELFY